MEQVETHGIQLYPLPDCDDDEDEDYKQQCQQLKVHSAALPSFSPVLVTCLLIITT